MQRAVTAPPVEPPTAENPPPRRWRPSPGTAVAALTVAAAAAFCLLFQWNWLRAPLAWAISAQIHRPVRILGDLDVAPWSSVPRASVNGLVIGDPSWAGPAPLARIGRITVVVKLGSLLAGSPVLPLAEIDRPDVSLLSDADGRRNWRFGAGPPGDKVTFPAIEHLVIRHGALRYADMKRRFRFVGRIDADERARSGPADAAQIAGALEVAAAPWAGPTPVLRAPRFALRVKLLDLIALRTRIELARADGPQINLVRDAAGRQSWSAGPDAKPLRLPPIGRLVIANGAFRYADAGRKLDFTGVLGASQAVTPAGQGAFSLVGRGVKNGQPFAATVSGGALVNIDKTRPYAFSADVGAGSTHIAAHVIVARPFDFGRLSGTLRAKGASLADLNPLTGLVLPSTPPYDLAAAFAREGKSYALRKLGGRVGDSDLGGQLSIDQARARPLLQADLVSRHLVLADLFAVIGGAPSHPAGHTLSPKERVVSTRQAAEHRLFPDTPLGLDHLRAMDAKVAYTAQSVTAGKVPVRGLTLRIDLHGGVLTADPLQMDLPQGRLRGLVRIDARAATPTTAIDLGLAGARLEDLIGRGKRSPPLQGVLFARARLSGSGWSVAQVMASANGETSLVVPQGEVRKSLSELLGVDVNNGLFLLLTKSRMQAPIRCAVADFSARDGVLGARQVVIDTDNVLTKGAGSIDLRDETIHLTLAGKPKKFRLIRLAAPITIGGRLDDPKFGIKLGRAAPQLAASAALGAVVAPLALIAPLVGPGLAHNADCAALVSNAYGQVRTG